MSAPKLTDALRKNMLRDYAANDLTCAEIGRKYGVSAGYVSAYGRKHGIGRGRGRRAARPKPATGRGSFFNGHVCTAACPKLGMLEWLPQHRVVSQGDDKGETLWDPDLTPYLLEVLEYVANPSHERAVVLKGSRIGYTEGVIGNALAYTIACDPADVSVLLPNQEAAREYVRDNFTRMVDYNPVVAEAMGGGGAHRGEGRRQTGQRLDRKEFEGGAVNFVGSAAPVKLVRWSAKRLFGDEVDKMKQDHQVGDPLSRFLRRSGDYIGRGRFMLVGSTPSTRESSLVWREWEVSDQRRWRFPCPHCESGMLPVWKDFVWDHEQMCGSCGVPWRDGAESCACGSDSKFLKAIPETIHLSCRECGGMISPEERADVIRRGEWVATNPRGVFPGWHMPAYISLLPAADWVALCRDWLLVHKDPQQLRVFVNETFGEVWEDEPEAKIGDLESRAEQYTDVSGGILLVPEGVGLLTAGVDVQVDRLELLVRGWGLEDESWDLVHHKLFGDPSLPAVWAELRGWLSRGYVHASGANMKIAMAFVDSGHNTQAVYRFTKPLAQQMVYASVGDHGKPGAKPVRFTGANPRKKRRDTIAHRMGVPYWTIGTFTQKDAVTARLAVRTPGPRYVHLRVPTPELCNGFGPDYYRQFRAEARVTVAKRGGGRDLQWKVRGSRPNEALDLHVMTGAAFDALDLMADVREYMPRLVAAMSAGGGVSGRSGRKRGDVRHRGLDDAVT